MHRYVVPASVKDRVVSRMSRLLAHDTIEAGRTALVVVDMQNYFCAQGFPAEVRLSREIVPNINRMAKTVRAAGGAVVWIQTTAVGALEHWRNYQTRMLTRHRQQARLAGLDEASEGFKLFPALEVLPGDIRVKRSTTAPSCLAHRTSTRLKARGIDTVLITGTATNVCWESTARDAMLLDYKVIMLSDGNATLTEEEHAGALNTFMMFFGDVMSTDEAIRRLAPVARCKTT
jgi:ureidoacrylate peracid hydrolase